MASLQRRASGRYRIIFTYSGDRFFVSLKTKNLKEATASLARLEENLHDLERGRISLPYGADLDVFLLSDGKLLQKPVLERSLSLKELFEHYQKNHPVGAKEANTRYTESIHLKHHRTRCLREKYLDRDFAGLRRKTKCRERACWQRDFA